MALGNSPFKTDKTASATGSISSKALLSGSKEEGADCLFHSFSDLSWKLLITSWNMILFRIPLYSVEGFLFLSTLC